MKKPTAELLPEDTNSHSRLLQDRMEMQKNGFPIASDRSVKRFRRREKMLTDNHDMTPSPAFPEKCSHMYRSSGLLFSMIIKSEIHPDTGGNSMFMEKNGFITVRKSSTSVFIMAEWIAGPDTRKIRVLNAGSGFHPGYRAIVHKCPDTRQLVHAEYQTGMTFPAAANLEEKKAR